MTTFLRLLETQSGQKGATLETAAGRWRAGAQTDGIFQVEPSSFGQVPGSPFAYWVSERVRRLFTELPAFEGEGRTVKQGLATADDFRFVRCWWEGDRAGAGEKWFPFAKGGAYSPFYSDVQLVVNWGGGGRELIAFGRSVIRNRDLYFRPGLTWPLRTQSGLSIRTVGTGSVFGHKGPMAFLPEAGMLLPTLAIMNSKPFSMLVELQMAFGSYEVGVLQRTPLPDLNDPSKGPLAVRAKDAWTLKRSIDTAAQTSHAFAIPALLVVNGTTLDSLTSTWTTQLAETEAAIASIQTEIDDLVFDLYRIDDEDRRQMKEGFGSLASGDVEEEAAPEDDADEVEGTDPVALTEALLEWALGVALGRFDVRLATGEREPPPDPDPFGALPERSPGMLQDGNGLPARAAPAGYPLDLPPHGILVDDPGHPWDVVTNVEAVFAVIAGDRGHSWIQEAEEILGRDLRDWLRRFGFERHLKRYSKSRRKAPLFWHLAPKSRDYGIWLYSPIATRDTFYRIQSHYVEPKLKAAERRLLELRQHAGASPTGQQRRALTAQESLVVELRAFREQVALIAPLWKPFRDDGVVLNCAVLSGLFDHHRAWQKECAKKWTEMASGNYDWAGWAMHLWPERVVKACASDRSLAIAHGLEEALWEEDDDGKWASRADADEQIAALVAERRSPAIEAALDAYVRAG